MSKTDDNRIASVLVKCDNVECGYRIVRTQDDRYAFVWGNIEARVDDTLDPNAVLSPTGDQGITIHDTYEEAEQAYNDCADALEASGGARAAEELRAAL
jgi:hypothetical protein